MAKVGIKDIARIANVSLATVSRTLRTPDLVQEATRQRVLDAVAESGYKPNRMGMNLRTQRTGNIMVIIPDITNPFNADLIRSIEETASNNGYAVLLGDTQSSPEREQQYVDLVEAGQADGMLYFSGRNPFNINPDKPLLEQLPTMVNSNEELDLDGIDKVLLDNAKAASEAVQYLLDLGHTRIAAVTGPMNTKSANGRLQGYRQALQQAGVEIDDKLIIEGDYHIDAGVEATEKLLRLKQRPTAIFCFNDDMAIGAINVLQANDYRIPEDISVIGFDDILYSTYVRPALTTVSQPVQEIGRLCTEKLIARLRGSHDEPTTTYVSHKLVVRDSTGPAPK
ncbi:LacI family DNA-binding transcriptional regulator [Neiella sp. HB171785]|uniref:LacI family DNA-binding transcriptional regulator n=1 Tax=Neiella litorisoli TaxID=2771431 RepID=A0A8J6UMB1_9GAMM|nr:LacI family DNA-binding transcriptional regulator [Neiella litorisoli]MBD1390405.1 LacI family DNA-binding transcriptional regulator [Neiella litorisoli]